MSESLSRCPSGHVVTFSGLVGLCDGEDCYLGKGGGWQLVKQRCPVPSCDACHQSQVRLPPLPDGFTPDSDLACVNPDCHVGRIHLYGTEPNVTAPDGSRITLNRAFPASRANEAR